MSFLLGHINCHCLPGLHFTCYKADLIYCLYCKYFLRLVQSLPGKRFMFNTQRGNYITQILLLLNVVVSCQMKRMGSNHYMLSRRRDKSKQRDLFSSAATPKPMRRSSSSIYRSMEISTNTFFMKAMYVTKTSSTDCKLLSPHTDCTLLIH